MFVDDKGVMSILRIAPAKDKQVFTTTIVQPITTVNSIFSYWKNNINYADLSTSKNMIAVLDDNYQMVTCEEAKEKWYLLAINSEHNIKYKKSSE